MRALSFRRLAVAVAALALLAPACGGDDGDEITIGAFNFSESAILAHIYAGALTDGGHDATVRANLGSREVVAPALERGEIDLYPGYAATELEFFNSGAGEATPDAAATVAKLRSRIESKGLTALDPSPAVDQNAFAVTRATAERLRLTKLSDLAAVGDQLTLGGPPECPTRPFCQAGLESRYGIRFKAFRALDAGGPLSKNALANGEVDVALIFSSDGAIPARNFVVLEDDRKLQNADAVVPLIKTDAATSEIRSILNRVSAALTTADLAAMNKSADIDKEDPEQLAKTWLSQHGFGSKKQ